MIAWLIPLDQVKYIKNKKLKDNTRKVSNIITHASKKKIPWILFFANAEKAFDRIEWPVMKEMLIRLGMGTNIIAWVDAVYNTPRARIKTNQISSTPFMLSRGVQQGCPLTSVLFNICVEVLAIHQVLDIRGLVCKTMNIR